jgi:hypothetical protein
MCSIGYCPRRHERNGADDKRRHCGAGKGGFQQANYFDYGSLYGTGSSYGEHYTASTLVGLGTEARINAALARTGKPVAAQNP